MDDVQNTPDICAERTNTSEPVKQPKKKSDSDSSSDEEPVLKMKKSTTVRGIRNLKPSGALSGSSLPAKRDCHVFSGGVADRITALRKEILRKEDLVKIVNDNTDDVQELDQEAVFESKSRSPPKNLVKSTEKRSDEELEILETASTTPEGVCIESPVTFTPSPPPVPKHLRRSRVRRAKATTSALAQLQYLNSFHKLSEMRDRTEDQCQSIIEVVSDWPVQREVVMKVRSRSGVQRFPMKPNDKFLEVMKAMAVHEGVSLDDIVMYVSGRDTAVQYRDTPESLKLTVADIIECRIRKKNSRIQDLVCVSDGDTISLRLQGKDSRTKMTIEAVMHAPLEVVFKQYAKERNLDYDKLKFRFDDDPISPIQTPEELEMTDDDCIDVIS